MKTFDDLPSGRDNHFNLIRLIAAAAVLVSHSYPLSLGMGSEEPLVLLTGHSLGTAAVYVFFGISGFMIARSFDHRTDIWSFVAARIARIFPGLLVVLGLTVLVLGPLVTQTDLRTYFMSSAVWTYIPRNLSLRFLQYELPQVFSDNVYPGVINGSLWTLFWEVICYGLVVGLGLLGGLQKLRFAAFLAVYVATAVALTVAGSAGNMVYLSFPFVTGMALYVFRSIVPAGFPAFVAVTLLAALLRETVVWQLLYGAALAYAALWLGHAKAPRLLWYNRLGDYSYGTYIYAFPVQQWAAWCWPGLSVTEMVALAMPITLILAICSWHWIESPALMRREKLTELFRKYLTPAMA